MIQWTIYMIQWTVDMIQWTIDMIQWTIDSESQKHQTLTKSPCAAASPAAQGDLVNIWHVSMNNWHVSVNSWHDLVNSWRDSVNNWLWEPKAPDLASPTEVPTIECSLNHNFYMRSIDWQSQTILTAVFCVSLFTRRPPSYHILSYFILSCHIVSYLIRSYSILSYPVI
jgi:hypothetical protein